MSQLSNKENNNNSKVVSPIDEEEEEEEEVNVVQNTPRGGIREKEEKVWEFLSCTVERG